MLPPDAVRTITIYPRYINQLTNIVKPLRRVLYNCSWEDKGADIILNTGQIVKDTIFIRIFDNTSGSIYLPPHEWNKLSESELDGYWTADLTLTSRPLIVGHESEFEFTAETSTQVTAQENTFRRENPDTALVSQISVNQKAHGSHIRLVAGS